MSKLLVTICGRAGSKGFKNKNLKTFLGKPLVHYSLSALELFLQACPGLQADIVLNTDSGLLRDLVCTTYPEVKYIHRPAALCGGDVPKMAVFQHSLATMEESRGYQYDYHMDLDITSPLRTKQDIAGCVSLKLARPDIDVVMSAVPSRRSPYMNMARRVDDCVQQVIKTNFTARQQTPQCYDLNASIYVFERKFLVENQTGFLWDGKCEIFTMRDNGVLDIDSEEDFQLMEVIAGYLLRTDEEFAEVKRNIR